MPSNLRKKRKIIPPARFGSTKKKQPPTNAKASSTVPHRSVAPMNPSTSSTNASNNKQSTSYEAAIVDEPSFEELEEAIGGHPSLSTLPPSPNIADTSPVSAATIVTAVEALTAFLQSDRASIPALVPNSTDGRIDFSTITPATNDFTMAGIMKSISDNPLKFGPDQHRCNMDDISMNTKGHEKVKAKFVRYFFQVLASHDHANQLAEMICDPSPPHKEKPRLFILCSGDPNENKHAILNWALCVFSMSLVMDEYRGVDLSKDPTLFAAAQYQPNTVETKFKYLFGSFKAVGIVYSQQFHFNGVGKIYLLPEMIVLFLLWLLANFVQFLFFRFQASSKLIGNEYLLLQSNIAPIMVPNQTNLSTMRSGS